MKKKTSFFDKNSKDGEYLFETDPIHGLSFNGDITLIKKQKNNNNGAVFMKNSMTDGRT